MKHHFYASVKNYIPKKDSGNSLTDNKGNRNKSLIPISGTAPRGVNVLSGTVANNMEVSNNKVYLFAAEEDKSWEDHEDYNGRASYSFSMVMEVDAISVGQMLASGPSLSLLHTKEEETNTISSSTPKVETPTN